MYISKSWSHKFTCSIYIQHFSAHQLPVDVNVPRVQLVFVVPHQSSCCSQRFVKATIEQPNNATEYNIDSICDFFW